MISLCSHSCWVWREPEPDPSQMLLTRVNPPSSVTILPAPTGQGLNALAFQWCFLEHRAQTAGQGRPSCLLLGNKRDSTWWFKVHHWEQIKILHQKTLMEYN